MKVLLRIGFVALIALGLASQALRAGRGGDDADPQAALVARLERLGVHATPIPESRYLKAESPQCMKPLLVGLLRGDGGENETARQFDRSDVEARYVYLGAVDTQPSVSKLFARWGWATVLFNVGRRPTKPPGDMVIVAFPRDCGSLERTDWASLSP